MVVTKFFNGNVSVDVTVHYASARLSETNWNFPETYDTDERLLEMPIPQHDDDKYTTRRLLECERGCEFYIKFRVDGDLHHYLKSANKVLTAQLLVDGVWAESWCTATPGSTSVCGAVASSVPGSGGTKELRQHLQFASAADYHTFEPGCARPKRKLNQVGKIDVYFSVCTLKSGTTILSNNKVQALPPLTKEDEINNTCFVKFVDPGEFVPAPRRSRVKSRKRLHHLEFQYIPREEFPNFLSGVMPASTIVLPHKSSLQASDPFLMQEIINSTLTESNAKRFVGNLFGCIR